MFFKYLLKFLQKHQLKIKKKYILIIKYIFNINKIHIEIVGNQYALILWIFVIKPKKIQKKKKNYIFTQQILFHNFMSSQNIWRKLNQFQFTVSLSLYTILKLKQN